MDEIQIQGLPQNESLFAIPTGPEAARFQLVRSYVEKRSLEAPRHADKMVLPNGGEVRLIWSLVDLDHGALDGKKIVPIRPVFKDPHAPVVLSVYNAGLFEATDVRGYGQGKGNTGNTEIKLAAGLFAETSGSAAPNAIIFLKPEGMNPEAFAQGQRLIGTAGATKLKEIADEYKRSHRLPPDKPVVFDLTGYSEGSTQIISIAAALDRRGIGQVRHIVSIGGAGFIGATSGEKAKPFMFVGHALSEKVKKTLKPTAPGVYPTGVFVGEGKPVFADRHISPTVLEHIRDQLQVTDTINVKDDVSNIFGFGRRLASTMIGHTQPGASVPWRRIKEACSYNDDIDYVTTSLSEKGTKVLVFADEKDPFFPVKDIKTSIDQIRALHPDAQISLFTGALDHAGPHYEQTAFNWFSTSLLRAWAAQSA